MSHPAATSSQAANYFGVTSCGTTTHIFNRCIQDLLFAPSGIVYPSIEEFCKPASFQGNWPWYDCLCSKYKVVNLCFETNCAGDASYSTAFKAETTYCATAAQYAPTVSPSLWSPSPDPSGPTLVIPTGGNMDVPALLPTNNNAGVKGSDAAAAVRGVGVVVGLIAVAVGL
ncbi:hypothetical protein HDU81_009507 [Chytriomyces hyalinus]|nr:hypothetical protein HDU81_009507 [Chytriomyces hyalinus]